MADGTKEKVESEELLCRVEEVVVVAVVVGWDTFEDVPADGIRCEDRC